MSEETDVEVVVVGGGLAGLSAALILARARRRVVVVDDGQPRNRTAVHAHAFITRDGVSPGELLRLARAECAAYGVRFVDRGVARLAAGFRVTTIDGAAFAARRLLVATGLRDLLPDIDGLAQRWGRDVHGCPHCHGWESDEPIAVLGTYPPSSHQALLLRQWSSSVRFFPNQSPDFDLALLHRNGIDVVSGPVSRLVVRGDRLIGVELTGGSVVPAGSLFVVTEATPNDELLISLGCERGATGVVTVDRFGRTDVPGVWAAGNVVDLAADLIGAAAAGSRAAIAINRDLVDEDAQSGAGAP